MSSDLLADGEPTKLEQLAQLAAPELPPRRTFDRMPPEPEGGADWKRRLTALLRYKWLVIAGTALGTAAGVGATRILKPEYRAQATIWIQATDRRGIDEGPIRSGQLLESSAWVELLKSWVVLDEVVRELRLYLHPGSPNDTVALASFRLKESFRPGAYRLEADERGRNFTLSLAQGQTLQQGAVGDSVGVGLGFIWVPPVEVLSPKSAIEFSVAPPREAAQGLAQSLRAQIDLNGNFLRIELIGSDPPRITGIVNAIVKRYVEVAARLKREKLTERSKILNEQLRYAERNLSAAEIALETFRVRTITLPADRGNPVTPGLVRTNDPVFMNFFEMKIEREQLRRDREAIERAMAQLPDSGRSGTALEVIGSVQRSSELRQALQELTSKQADLRALRYRYTDEHPPVQRLLGEIATLERKTIPVLTTTLVAEIRAREVELDERIAASSRDLRQIPPRAIEEARLRRDVASAENLHTVLQQRYEEARLAEASSIPDVRILDVAVVPQRPIRNTAPRLILMGFLAGLGLTVVGAILLDRVDPRLRYPEQVTREMGLAILGAVPHVKGHNGFSGEDAAHVIEALRSIRLSLVHAYGAAGPLLVTITSPGSGDGKSFIASNLALAFADNGHRTLLIDGDLRRGTLHRLLNASRKPGLIDFLAGNASRDEIVQATDYSSLWFIGCGTRTQAGPELLGSAGMSQLVTSLRTSYGVILVDSPPLGAGVDPFLLGTVTGNLLLVLRTGFTNRQLTEAKLDVLDRLPIRILGTVLNDVHPGRAYRYYGYAIRGYASEEEEGSGAARTGGGGDATSATRRLVHG